jgi:hypothetical protein
MKSWKTNLGAAICAFGAAVSLIDPDWIKWGALLTAAGTSLGLLFARDNNVTSEQALSRKPTRAGVSIPIKLTLLAAAGVLLLGTGCAGPSRLAPLIAQLKEDPATVHVSVQSIYGTLKFTRVGGQTNNAVTVSPDGTVTLQPGKSQSP